MRRATILILAAMFVFALSLTSHAAEGCKKNPMLGKLRHVVVFKFKDGTSPEDIKKVEEAFAALPSKIPTIVAFEWGTNNSPENLAQGFTHCFFLTFNDAEGRAVYLPHPAHKEFGKILRPHLEKAFVIDYVVQE